MATRTKKGKPYGITWCEVEYETGPGPYRPSSELPQAVRSSSRSAICLLKRHISTVVHPGNTIKCILSHKTSPSFELRGIVSNHAKLEKREPSPTIHTVCSLVSASTIMSVTDAPSETSDATFELINYPSKLYKCILVNSDR